MDVGDVLTSCSTVIYGIFKHLNARDLAACAQVCKFWNVIAKTEAEKRKNIDIFFEGVKCKTHGQIHTFYSECDEEDKDLETALQADLRDIRSRPDVCIIFKSRYLHNNMDVFYSNYSESTGQPKVSRSRRPTKKMLRMAETYGLHPFLASKCKINSFVTEGVAAAYPGRKAVEVEEGPALCGVIFPKLPGVNIVCIKKDDLNTECEKLMTSDIKLKCLIFLDGDNRSLDKWLFRLAKKENFHCAVGGAIIASVSETTLIAFHGSNVEAASLVVRSKFADHIVKQMSLFKKTNLLQHRCVAFLFICVGRGAECFNEENLETSLFQKLYPNVPIIGCFGSGEFGLHYLPNTELSSKDKEVAPPATKKKRDLCHGYTSIVVLLAFKE